MTMLPAFLSGANVVMHAAGWLESGLVSCFEKYIVDIEILRMLLKAFTPLEISEESLAFSAHQEVGHGGHFLGAAHTLERFRDCFYRPLLSSSQNYERWMRKGAEDATARASSIWREKLAAHEPPRSTEQSVRSFPSSWPREGRSWATDGGTGHIRPRKRPGATVVRTL